MADILKKIVDFLNFVRGKFLKIRSFITPSCGHVSHTQFGWIGSAVLTHSVHKDIEIYEILTTQS